MPVKVAIALDETPIPAAVARWFDDRDVAWVPFGNGGQAGVSALVVGGFTPIGSAEVDSLPDLGLVVRTGAGYEHVDVGLLAQRGIALVAPRLDDDPSVAEFVIGSVIAVLRRLVAANAAARAGDWAFRERVFGREIRDLTFGIVGVGRIGRQVARLARSLGCRVIAWHPWSDRELPDGVDRAESLAQLLVDSDVVSLHCRLDDSTKGLIDAGAIAQMRPGAILVNTARGGLVDEAALLAACRDGRLGGAVIDTFRDEPWPDTSGFADVDNILLAPHIAGMTGQSVARIADFVGAACCRFVRDAALPADHVVTRPA